LLALIVERASGQRFAAFLHDHIFTPLGMNATVAFEDGISTVATRAYGYSADGASWERTDQSSTSAVLGDGGIYSNVDDLARWDRALTDATIIDRGSLAEATTPPLLAGGVRSEYGFGWFVDQYRGEKRWRHTGETSGFRNAILRFPEKRLTIIILTNRSSGEPQAIAERIADRVLFR